MQKKFITNLALLLLLNFLIKPFWIFGIDLEVQNMVNPEEYGVYFTLFNFSLLFHIILDLGITNYNNRNIAQHPQLLTKYFSGIVVFKLLLAVAYFIITFSVGFVLGYDSSRFHLLLFLSINQLLVSFIQYLRSNVAGLQLFTLDSLLSVLDKTLMIIFCSVLLWGNLFNIKFGIKWFIYSQTLAYVITAFVVFVIVLIKSKKITFKLDFPFLLVMLKQTLPYALLVLTMTIYYRLDAVMLDLMLEDGEKQVAIYAQAYRLMDASTQIGVLFAALLLPMFARMIKMKQRLGGLVKLSFSLLFIPAIVLAIISFFFSANIMDLLYKVDTVHSSEILRVLMGCFVAIAITYVFGTLLTANGNLKQLNRIAVGGMLLNVLLNWVLIPYYQALGSAIASLITQFLVVVFQLIVVKRIFQFNIDFKFIGSILLYILLLFFVVKGIEVYLSGFLLQLIAVLLSSLILALLLKIINIREMYVTIIQQPEDSIK